MELHMSSGVYPDFLGTLDPRNSNGTGNNLANSNWGAPGVYVRVTPNSYADGLSVMETGPAPRDISNAVMAQPKIGGVDVDLPSAAEINEFFQFFGQFITHDVTEAVAGDRSVSGEVLSPRPAGLPQGFDFVRTGFTTDTLGVRQQFTRVTSFLDLSMVYGATDAMQALLRDNVGGAESAKMLTSITGVLPTFQDVADDNPGKTVNDVLAVNGGVTSLGNFSPNLLVSGDDRTNQSAALITQHTIWMREHNYQVDKLAAQHPTWSQEKLFQAARAITEAEWQHVVYSEYLTKLVGENAIDAYAGYKPNVNPAVINEWATIAFRFGHDQSSNSFNTLAENGANAGTFTLAAAFDLANAANAIRNGGSLDQWVRGQLSHQTQEIDGKIVEGNRNLLFGGGTDPNVDPTIDLNVLDIQRGRDHGVGDYNTLRAGLQLSPYASFQAFAADNNLDNATLQALISVYGSIGNLDSLVGGLLEKHAAGSQVGITFTRLIVAQFENLRDGDRFYYENRFSSHQDFIDAIKETSLSDIIARNTGIKYLYHDAFAAHERVGGTDGAETLNGAAKKDLIIGFAGDDVANGGSGDDDIYGGQGQDHLRGDAGTDRLAGEEGNDTLEGGAGGDRLNGGDGADTASYAGSAAVVIDLQNASASGGDASGDTLISIENLTGGAGGDSLTGDGGNNQLSGGGGNDALRGAAGNDTLDGSDGNDHLDGGTGADAMYGGSGDDVYIVDDALDLVSDSSGYDTVYASVNYTLAANSGIEALVITGGNGVNLTGNASANILMGGNGPDHLNGLSGNDRLYGGVGHDKHYVGKGSD
jgi:Ca2+-binding RTX toxin-like protein